jgi:Flp pilus assembly protein CpaB
MLRPVLFLAAFAVFFASQSPLPPAKGDDPKPTLVAVLVARRDIPSFESLDEPEKLFKVVHYLKGDEPRDAVMTFEEVKGKYLEANISEDQPLRKSHIGFLGGARGLMEVGEGRRAMFVRLPTAAIGNIEKYCRVDLYGTSKEDSTKEPELLIKNLLILAISEAKDGFDGGVTFAATPESCQVITKCAKTMDFTLKVRRRENAEVVKRLVE